MLEDFKEAFLFADNLLEEIAATMAICRRFLIYAMLPVWIIPYAFHKAIHAISEARKEIRDNGF